MICDGVSGRVIRTSGFDLDLPQFARLYRYCFARSLPLQLFPLSAENLSTLLVVHIFFAVIIGLDGFPPIGRALAA